MLGGGGCKTHITDGVIEQLGLHCHNLKEIYLSSSSRVTNASVQHLLRLRKLEILEMTHTEIDNEHYLLLLSELPIKNIRFSPPHENILHHVADGKLHKISRRGHQLWDVVYIYIYTYRDNHLFLWYPGVYCSHMLHRWTYSRLEIVWCYCLYSSATVTHS
jgi:hypothetical protein